MRIDDNRFFEVISFSGNEHRDEQNSQNSEKNFKKSFHDELISCSLKQM